MFRSAQHDKKLFAELDVYHDDDSSGTAALNMAIDEALLETAMQPTIRFYRWDHPAISFGYFGKFSEVETSACDLVRRWTGGGIVHHGEDLTYSVVIPVGDPVLGESSIGIYEKVHRALCEALTACGENPRLAPLTTISEHQAGECFANPVRADVMLNGRKIAGAAQRRSKRGLLQQGSIQDVQLTGEFPFQFASALSQRTEKVVLSAGIQDRALQLAREKYATHSWLRKR